MLRPLTQDDIAQGQRVWRQVRNAIQNLCHRYNADDSIRALLSSQLRDGQEKDPVGYGADMLLESAEQLIKPMVA